MDATSKSTNTPNILRSLSTQARKLDNPDHLKNFLERARFSVDSIKVTSRPVVPSRVFEDSGNPSQHRQADTNSEHSVALEFKSPTAPGPTHSPSIDTTAKKASFKEAVQQKAIEGKGKPKHLASPHPLPPSSFDHHIGRFVAERFSYLTHL